MNIAVLDDHHLIVEAISALIEDESNLNFSAGFSTAKELIDSLEKGESNIDILLLDIQLDKEDGIKVCEIISKNYPSIKIIMLSSITQSSVVMNSFKKGATGYLPKNIDLKDLKDACDAVLQNKTYIHPSISLIEDSASVTRSSYVPRLTRREKEVLTLIMEELTTAQIAERLCLTTSTIESHRASLFLKTDYKNVVGLIKYTLEYGLLDR